MLGSCVEGILHDMPEDALKPLGMGQDGDFRRTIEQHRTGNVHSFGLHHVFEQPFE
jgi:hypothetical protein